MNWIPWLLVVILVIALMVQHCLYQTHLNPWPQKEKGGLPFAILAHLALGPFAGFKLAEDAIANEENDPRAKGMRNIIISGPLMPGVDTDVVYVGGAEHYCAVTIYGTTVGINGSRALFNRATPWGQDTEDALFNCAVRLTINGPALEKLQQMALESMRQQRGVGRVNREVNNALAAVNPRGS